MESYNKKKHLAQQIVECAGLLPPDFEVYNVSRGGYLQKCALCQNQHSAWEVRARKKPYKNRHIRKFYVCAECIGKYYYHHCNLCGGEISPIKFQEKFRGKCEQCGSTGYYDDTIDRWFWSI